MNNNCKNVLLSYPRSGNHLCRFFIEFLSELPTYGCNGNLEDIEIYKNKFDVPVQFNIPNKFNKNNCYFKYHNPPYHINTKNLILIIRNPKEVLVRQCGGQKLNINNNWYSYESYFKSIDFYNNYKGKKLLLYYEDMITNKTEFINTIYDFLDINNLKKKNYVLSNIDKLFNVSRNTCINKSNGKINFYYEKISNSIKNDFDSYLNNKLEKYSFLKNKYNI
jgi:hypothetical protein